MITGLDDVQMLQLSTNLLARGVCQALHRYIESTRQLIDGLDPIVVPESHKDLGVAENHEGGHRLNYRIRQGAAWLDNADVRFRITAASPEKRDAAARMKRFAYFGEKRLARGTSLHRWKQEAARDIFECGVAIVQNHPAADYYINIADNPQQAADGVELDDLVWRRRVDPLYAEWAEDNAGEVAAFQVMAWREVGQFAKLMSRKVVDGLAPYFDWAESLPATPPYFSSQLVQVRELWCGDRGVLVVIDEPNRENAPTLSEEDPRRVLASWRNPYGHPPFYFVTIGTQPWHSPLDEMIQLTNLRNMWATMLDLQAAGAIFRHWQLVDANTGDTIDRQIWRNPVPEHVLLDMSKPPPNMGPGTEWKLAPFEMNDVVPRYTQIKEQHEAAASSVARLMGDLVGERTAVGTADSIEGYARLEFADWVEALQDMYSRIWEDFFGYIKDKHKDPVQVVARERGANYQFLNTLLEVRGSDIVSEDVSSVIDTRSRVAKIADYQLGRMMQNNGDIDYDRRVEEGLVPYVDDSQAEKAAIFISEAETISLEEQVKAFAQQVMQNLQPTAPQIPAPPMTSPNMTHGSQSDPRGTGVGAGPDNISDTGISAGGADLVDSSRVMAAG